MTITVDVVVVGANRRALAAAIGLARGGKRVLVMTRTRGGGLRRRIRHARGVALPRIRVLAGVEVECIAGTRTVEAVLARYLATGRRIDVNASALLTFEDELETGTAREAVRC